MKPRGSGGVTDVQVYLLVRAEDSKGNREGRIAFEKHKHKLSSDHARWCANLLLKNRVLKTAFDPTLQVPALRHGMRLSTMNKLIFTKSDQV
jgi:hypothetical protein